MNVDNNRSFNYDFSTQGYSPLGGIVSVAYEIGFASNQTDQIAQDFFKAPILTTFKKIAQWLWVPIVLCGTLKLTCLIVNACWYRCFPPTNNRPIEESQIIDLEAKDPCKCIPQEIVISHIFYDLNLHELGVCRSISKEWDALASKPILWQSAICREIAFSSKNWALWNEDIVKEVDFTKEHLSLPENIVEELRLSHEAFPEKNFRKTHVLVIMPKGLTIKMLGEFAKKDFPNNADGYKFISPLIFEELEDKPVDEAVWLLMTSNEVDGTRDKSYEEQKNIIAELAKTAQIPYEVPTTLEAATCILAEYSRSGRRLFNESSWLHIHCQENVQGRQMLVGGFELGLLIHNNEVVKGDICAAALRKF